MISSVSQNSEGLALTGGKTQIMIVHHERAFQRKLIALLGSSSEYEVTSIHKKSCEALQQYRIQVPDVVICSIFVPGLDGLEFVRTVRAEFSKAKILVVSSYDEGIYALRSLKAGAKGFLRDDDCEVNLMHALATVARDHCYVSQRLVDRLLAHHIHAPSSMEPSVTQNLSNRELQVLMLVAQKLKSRSIADRLYISIKTVETHRSHIKEKLGIGSSQELRNFAITWLQDMVSRGEEIPEKLLNSQP